MSKYNEKLLVNTIRSLGIDMIDQAKSGHPGIVLGAANIMYNLFANHLKFHSGYPNWCNRDRFIMSAGHGSALLYATLYVNGFDYTIDDLKNFRNLNSKTPGHPEKNENLGIDMTTGPLGQGIATSVGMAISEKYLKKTFNTKNQKIFDYKIYVLCGEGDLMEGISYEAASLAANLKLNNLILLYDSNNITLDGESKLSLNEDIMYRFEALGWNTIEVSKSESSSAINKAINKAKKSKHKPTIIKINTTIGKYSINENTNKVHGSPLAKEDITNIKKKLKLSYVPFDIDLENIKKYQQHINSKNKEIYDDWRYNFDEYIIDKQNTKKDVLLSIINQEKFQIRLEKLINLNEIDENLSMREQNQIIMNHISKYIPELIGGSADVSSSTKIYLNEKGNFSYENYTGRNIYYGIREHLMAAATNGIALSNLKPFASTFLTFADYMKPSIRLSALMNIPSTFIFTHDTITIGQDGPTHQPIEQLSMLRSIPNFEVYRPCDINELVGCWNQILIEGKPCSLVLSRNNSKKLDNSNPTKIKYGGYIVRDSLTNIDLVLISSGSEVNLAINIASKLEEENIKARVVSVPNLNKLLKQEKNYLNELIPQNKFIFVIEYSNDTMWYELANIKEIFNIKKFGLSGKKEDILNHFELTEEQIIEKIKKYY